jgi:hypothetical protein
LSKVYILGTATVAKQLQRLRCKDEEAELQDLLERNPYLLPSEQIFPENPPQWLLVKREMPVTDPGTGSERWSVDFLFVDHMAIPTLVECKRCDDTRSRREVIAQMLEYAANGHQYWSAEDLQAYAQDAAGGLEQLDAWVARSYSGGGGTTQFFEAAVANLRKATMRLIFFLEESPFELRSLVEFLNGQLKETEVLLVEARLYDSPSGRVVVPWLFGYTEQARVAKRESRTKASLAGTERGEEAYRRALAQDSVPDVVRSAVDALLGAWPTGKLEVAHWSFGVNAIFITPALPKRGLFHVTRVGDLSLYLGYWNPDDYPDVGPTQVAVRDSFMGDLSALLGIQLNEKQLRGFPTIKASQWIGKVSEIIAILNRVTEDKSAS